MSAMDWLVESYFKKLNVNKSEFTGFIDGSGEFCRFREDLRAIGFLYSLEKVTHGSAYLFGHAGKRADVQIPYFGSCFQVTQSRSYQCRFGNKKSGAKYSENVNELNKDQSELPSKKIVCKAQMYVSQLTVYPEYTVSEYNPNGSPEQKEVRRKLLEAIEASKRLPPYQAGRPPTTFLRYSISLPRASIHCHSLAPVKAGKVLHLKLAAELKQLAAESVTVPRVRIRPEASDNFLKDETNPESLVNVKLVSPYGTPMEFPKLNIVLQSDLVPLRSEISKLLVELRVNMRASKSLEVLEELKRLLIAASLVLEQETTKHTVFAHPKALRRYGSRRLRSEIDKGTEHGSNLGV